jgi:hypothetical protein
MTAKTAYIPNFGDIRKHLKAGKPSVTNTARAFAAQCSDSSSEPACSGKLTVGMFFDGTDNNIERDFGTEEKPLPFMQWKHSNVARLYKIFKDEEDTFLEKIKDKFSGDRIYSYYIPGLGTKFPEIGDSGEGFGDSTLGAAAGRRGEPRVLWAMVQTLNSIYRFWFNKPLITNLEAKAAIDKIVAKPVYEHSRNIVTNISTTAGGTTINALGMSIYKTAVNQELRLAQFKEWIARIEPLVATTKPKLLGMTLYAFGFSRGAAEARAYMNWLVELCTKKDGKLLLAGVPLRIPFLGIFDTVASVGIAGLYSWSEGHLSWAAHNMQIPPEVGKCVHMVAGNEVRSCFPLDSVRVDGSYPANTLEIVYPGSHSDLGGGYPLGDLGKNNCDKQGSEPKDLQIARVPCFDMYLRALANGAPFYSLKQLAEHKRDVLIKAFLPDSRTVDALEKYIRTSGAKGSVEDHLRQHTGLYLGWRWKQGKDYFTQSDELRRLGACDAAIDQADVDKAYAELENIKKREDARFNREALDRSRGSNTRDLNWWKKLEEERQKHQATIRNQDYAFNANNDAGYLKRTQSTLIAVVAGYCNEIIRRLADADTSTLPLDNTLRGYKGATILEDVSVSHKDTLDNLAENAISLVIPPAKLIFYSVDKLFKDPTRDLYRRGSIDDFDLAKYAPLLLREWTERACLVQYDTTNSEKEAIFLLKALDNFAKQPEDIQAVVGKFFSDQVHDSVAGFIGKNLDEFTYNGYGIAKFRRIFFGNNRDAFTVKHVEQLNAARASHFKSEQARMREVQKEVDAVQNSYNLSGGVRFP